MPQSLTRSPSDEQKRGLWADLEWRDPARHGLSSNEFSRLCRRHGIDPQGTTARLRSHGLIHTDERGNYWRGDGSRHGAGSGAGLTASLIQKWIEEEVEEKFVDHVISEIDRLPNGRSRRAGMLTVRLGQAKFRKSLLELYERKCWISGCSVDRVLQAAHIEPHSNENNKLSNGMILRADLHNLFDANLLWIQPTSEGYSVRLSPTLGNEYQDYRDKPLDPPGSGTANYPDREYLDGMRPDWHP
jgi:HNH endonuclease